MWLGIKTFSKHNRAVPEDEVNVCWLLWQLGRGGGARGAADWCPLHAPCSSVNLGWQGNEPNVDTLTHPTIYLPLSISPSFPLLSLTGGCISSDGWRTTHQNPWCHPAASSAALQVRLKAYCPPLAGTGTARCTHQLCVSVNVKIKGFCSATLHWMESFNRSQLTFALVMMNWISHPLWKHTNANVLKWFLWDLST